jgi:hypothetical protein
MRKNAHARRAGLALLLLVALPFPAYAESPAPADKWTFGIQPYLWLPSLSGDLTYSAPGGSPSVDVSSDALIDELNFAFMISAEARKGRWAIVTDFITLDIGGDDSKVKSVDFSGVPVTVSGGAKVDVEGVLWALAGSYTVARSATSSLDVLLGFRYFTIDITTDYNLSADIPGQTFARAGSIKQGEDLWDGIVGVRGRIGLGSGKWGIPYYLDVGTGSSTITWQGAGGIGYQWSWIDLNLMYRYLYYDMEGGKLLQNLSFSGPALGVNFRF